MDPQILVGLLPGTLVRSQAHPLPLPYFSLGCSWQPWLPRSRRSGRSQGEWRKRGLGSLHLPGYKAFIPLIFCLLCYRVPLESEGLVAWLVPRELMVTLAVLENLAFLEPG